MSLARRLAARDRLLGGLRRFFAGRGYIEVDTPAVSRCPGIDPYIDAIPAGDGFFLSTSPELFMKRLLAAGLERIVQISHAFRAGEVGSLHNPEFTICEWYAAGSDYEDLMDETESLVRVAASDLAEWGIIPPTWPDPIPRCGVDEAFQKWAGWAPSENFDADRFFADLVDKVEVRLAEMGAVFLVDFPEALGSLARRKAGRPRLCERFELYLGGLEICNGFSELTDPVEQAERFDRANRRRVAMGKQPYPVDDRFLAALESLPPCAGNAMGVERLLLALVGSRRLGDVWPFPFSAL